jgi:hypothetical protein
MKRPVYRAPAEQRTHREQPVYDKPDTFAHPSPIRLPKDTPIEAVPLEAQVPIPVSVVDTPRGPDRLTSFNTTNATVESLKEYSISRNDNRRALKIINNDYPAFTQTLYINSKPGMGANGYPLLPGKEWTTTSTREVYIYNPGGASVNVGITYDLVIELA